MSVHEEQIVVWADELMSDLALHGLLSVVDYDDKVTALREIKEKLRLCSAHVDDAAAVSQAAAVKAEHWDDYCVDQFAKMMRDKMALSRAKGRSGWDDPSQCSVDHLRALLYLHLEKGDPVDVANICMMLRHYDATTALLPSGDLTRLFDPDGHWGDFIKSAVSEAEKAMQKFPQPNYVISKVAEEAGEVVKAAIHAAEGRETLQNVRGEMKQLVAMLYRLWLEGDQVHGLPPVSSVLSGKNGGAL